MRRRLVLKLSLVRIPPAKRDGDNPHAGLDQPPGHEEVVHAAGWPVFLVVHVADAIPGAKARVFALEVECFEHAFRAEDLERSLVEHVQPVHHLRAIEGAPHVVKLRRGANGGSPAAPG